MVVANPPALCESIVEDAALVVAVLLESIRETEAAYRLRDELIAHIDQSQTDNLVIDLKQVRYIGSVGLTAFLTLRRRVPGRIIICGACDALRDMFVICRLTPTRFNSAAPFELAASKDVALAFLQK